MTYGPVDAYKGGRIINDTKEKHARRCTVYLSPSSYAERRPTLSNFKKQIVDNIFNSYVNNYTNYLCKPNKKNLNQTEQLYV